MSSELKEIYKFLFDYFKIYKESSGPNVSNWKIADLNNAIKWSNGIEEFYGKIRHKKYLSKLIEDIKLVLRHWKIDCKDCEDLLKNATFKLKKSLIANKHLSDELKSNLTDSLVNQQIEKIKENKIKENFTPAQENDQLNHEIDKICLKLYLFNGDPYLIDFLLDFTINHQDNLDFIILIFEKLKDLSYETYKVCFLRILNRKYYKLYKRDPSNGLFDLNSKELIQAYYCYLIFVFMEIVDEFKLQDKDINDPKNHNTDFFDLKNLVAHFENAIKLSNDSKLIKILQNKAKIDSDWNFLLNEMKLRYLKQTQPFDNLLNDLIIDDFS
ncbi:unnamed protein product [Brachionus calyciflorus]|uniref:Uncharacterized protein n=1 Tax=Brachionus calyciflorus TaxID=104777 RepID=A0A813MA68_9BILA|nr:unnamed protein product [Brachionus calyciflorus]